MTILTDFAFVNTINHLQFAMLSILLYQQIKQPSRYTDNHGFMGSFFWERQNCILSLNGKLHKIFFRQRPQQGTKSCRMGRFSVLPSIRMYPLLGHQAWPEDKRGDICMDRHMDGQTQGKSSHSTGLCPLSGPLPCFPKEDLGHKEKQGKGTTDHLMPLSNWL